eukprot:SAG31_NODE_2108_length_6427_cov_7.816688_6_plen_59_part_00
MDLLVNMIKSCREGLCVHDVEKLDCNVCVRSSGIKQPSNGNHVVGLVGSQNHLAALWM